MVAFDVCVWWYSGLLLRYGDAVWCRPSDAYIANHIDALRAHGTNRTAAVVTNMCLTGNAHLTADHITAYTEVPLGQGGQQDHAMAVFACADLAELADLSHHIPGAAPGTLDLGHANYSTTDCKHAVIAGLAQLNRNTPPGQLKPLAVLIISGVPISREASVAYPDRNSAREAMVDDIIAEIADLDVVVINFPSPRRQQVRLGVQCARACRLDSADSVLLCRCCFLLASRVPEGWHRWSYETCCGNAAWSWREGHNVCTHTRRLACTAHGAVVCAFSNQQAGARSILNKAGVCYARTLLQYAVAMWF